MAVDIVEHIDRLEIPHLPGTKFKLRIGCHSGPVVAAVIGTKMPRYCLFGVTINVASAMESFGAANKIHISETTRDLLCELGGFVVELRTDSPPQLKAELEHTFRGEVRTYWLLTREGNDALASGSSFSSVDSVI